MVGKRFADVAGFSSMTGVPVGELSSITMAIDPIPKPEEVEKLSLASEAGVAGGGGGGGGNAKCCSSGIIPGFVLLLLYDSGTSIIGTSTDLYKVSPILAS